MGMTRTTVSPGFNRSDTMGNSAFWSGTEAAIVSLRREMFSPVRALTRIAFFPAGEIISGGASLSPLEVVSLSSLFATIIYGIFFSMHFFSRAASSGEKPSVPS